MGAGFAAIALGLYQSYISVTIVLVMMSCMMALLEGKEFKDVLVRGLKAIAMLATAGVLYFIALKACDLITGIDQNTGTYNGLDSMYSLMDTSILKRIQQTYTKSGLKLMTTNPIAVLPRTMMRIVNAVFCLCAGVVAVSTLLTGKVKKANRLLFAVLGILLPFGANVAYFLSGSNHTLMLYAIWFVYLLVMLIFRWKIQNKDGTKVVLYWKGLRNVTVITLAMILFSNILVSNAVYLKKDLERSATLSIVTRVVDDIEEIDGYEPGETKLCLVGLASYLQEKAGFGRLTGITGTDFRSQMTNPTSIQNYFKYVLEIPVAYIEHDYVKLNKLTNSPEVKAMPIYPAEGSIAFVDDVLVVKLG